MKEKDRADYLKRLGEASQKFDALKSESSAGDLSGIDQVMVHQFIVETRAAIEFVAQPDSPYRRHMKTVIESDMKPAEKAEALMGIAHGMSDSLRDGKELLEGDTGHYEVYDKFARKMKYWLIAYGIGGPVLFVSQDAIAQKIIESGRAITITLFFLIGVALQIAISLYHKLVMWYPYWAGDIPERRQTWKFQFSVWASENMCIDLIVDILTIILFVLATFLVMGTLIPPKVAG